MRTFVSSVFLITFITSSCKRLSSSEHIVFNSDKDTVSNRLQSLPESKITRINVDPLIVTYDSVRAGAVLQGKIKITNNGSNDFYLSQIVAGCGCTSVKESSLNISPGNSDYLHFRLNTEDFKPGYNNRAITILGNFRPFFRQVLLEVYVVE